MPVYFLIPSQRFAVEHLVSVPLSLLCCAVLFKYRLLSQFISAQRNQSEGQRQPCFVARQENQLKRINMCEIGEMIVPNISQQSTQETQRETLGTEKTRKEWRLKEREGGGGGFYSVEGHTRTERRELKDDRRMKDEDKWREKDIAHLHTLNYAVSSPQLLLVLLRHSCEKQ